MQPQDIPKKTKMVPEAGEEGKEIVVDIGVEPRTTTFAAAALMEEEHGSPIVDIDLFDSDASQHMSGHCHCFVDFTKIESRPITAADLCSFSAIGKESLYLELSNGGDTLKILLSEVLYALCMGVTLVSISQVTDAKSSVLFHGNICRIFNSLRTILGEVPKHNGLYQIFTSCPQTAVYAGKAVEVLSIDELYRRLGYVGHDAVHQLMRKGLIKELELDKDSKPSFCESCKWGKGHQKAIQRERKDDQVKAIDNQVHLDVWGPAPVETINHMEYIVTFTDDCSRDMEVYFMKKKDKVFDNYINYEAWLKTQHGAQIKKL